jgi:hypothetical protein
MPLQVPPSITAPAPLPSHVHASLTEAERAAARAAGKGSDTLLVYIAATRDQAQAAHEWTTSLDGARARGSQEIWIASPGDPEGLSLLDRFQIRSTPALLELVMDGKKPALLRTRFGSDAESLTQAFQLINVPSPQEVAESASKLCAVHPDLGKPETLIDFQKARQADIHAAASEPYRTWLMGVLKTSTNRDVKAWSATRLAEACAPLRPGDIQPYPFVAARAYDDMITQLKSGTSSQAAFHPFGGIAEIEDEAPFWPAFRKVLADPGHFSITAATYALMSPHLRMEDRPWLLSQMATGPAEKGNAWNSATMWISLDWLMVYGEPKDWADFTNAAQGNDWKEVLSDEAHTLQTIEAYWGVPRRVQDMFCDGVTADEFWKNPEGCLQEWGVTREALVSLAWNEDRVKKQAFLPSYPIEAKRRRLMDSVSLELVVDSAGKVRAIRPRPGYALAFFAAEAMRWASKTVFEPAKVAGVPRPGKFIYHLNFKLQ